MESGNPRRRLLGGIAILGAVLLIVLSLSTSSNPGGPSEEPSEARIGETPETRSAAEHDDAEPAEAPAPTEPREEGPLPGAIAWIEVFVRSADGAPVEAMVFAAPAGSGVSLWDAPSADHVPPGPGRIGISRGGEFVVGALSGAPRGLVRSAPTTVREGETVRVDLVLDEARPITFVPVGDWPVGKNLEDGIFSGSILVEATDTDVIHCFVDLNTPGPWRTPPFPVGRKYRVLPGISVAPKHREVRGFFPGYRILAEPPVAQAGDTVRLRAKRAGRLVVAVRIEGKERWGGGPVCVRFELRQGKRTTRVDWKWPSLERFLTVRRPLRITGLEGPAVLTWAGRGFLPGELGSIRLSGERTEEVEVRLHPDPGEAPVGGALRLRIAGGPRREKGEKPTVAGVEAVAPRAGDEIIDRFFEGSLPLPGGSLDAGWRRAKHLVVRVGTEFVSHAVPIPEAGDVEAVVRPAGILEIRPKRDISEELGELIVRRPDGRPFFGWDPDNEILGIRTETVAVAGTRIGPLPEGTHTFEVTLGGQRLPDATATVKAGRVEPLCIR